MNYNIKVLSPKEYLKQFPKQAEEVSQVIGKPTSVSANKVITALKTNCVSMKDTRSKIGKLHCMMDLSSMEANKTAIAESTDLGELDFNGMVTEEARAVYMTQYCVQKAHWEAVENIKDECKTFLLSRFEPVYFQALSHSVTKFKNVIIKELIEHLHNKYPPAPEEVTAVEASLREQWDPTNHIDNPFQAVKKGTETLLQMDFTTRSKCNKVFIKYVYTAVKESGQFNTACIKWKALPKGERSTNKQCREYFGKKYKVFEASQDSLSLACVANSVQQVQELEQVTRSGFISIQDKQDKQDAVNTRRDAINASVLQMVAARSTTGGGIDDNATAFSALTASSAVKDRRIIDLELQLRRANTNTTPPPPTGGGSAFPWRGGGGSSRGGGRGGG
jgi:hypothetical protein